MAIIKDEHNPSISTYPAAFLSGSLDTFYATNWMAQTFVAGSTYNLYAIALRLALYTTNPNQTFVIDIQGVDGDGKPDGTPLVQVTKDSAALPGINYWKPHLGANPWTIITFDGTLELTSGTTYAIVCHATTNSGIVVNWTGQESAKTGHFHESRDDGSTWTQWDNWDLAYQTYSNFELQDSNTAGSESALNGGGTYWLGQTWTPSSDYTVKSVGLRLKKVGASIGNVIVSIRATAAGIPTGGDVATALIPAASLTSALAWHEAVLDVPFAATNGTMYAIVIRSTGSAYPASQFQLGYVSGGDVYANGTKLSSDDYGITWASVGGETDDIWFRLFGIGSGAVSSPLTDATTVKRLCAVGGNQFWYENSDGDMVVLAASVDDIDTSEPLTMAEAYGKMFIANGNRLRVVDFVNVKIATADTGTNPPDFDTVLTGGTSGAEMIVDYTTSISGGCTIYGRRTTSNIFQASETVTGTDDDGNAISFVMTAADEVLPPHWYPWTVYGQDATNFGEMPTKANLVSDYNGRLVLAGNLDYPHEWWMSKVYNPFNWLYQEGSYLTAVTSGSIEAGQMGDVITALIPYADDYFVFGCASSVHLLDGDPTIGGTIERLSGTEGVYGAHAWCKDNQSNLYFFSGDGFYKAGGGRNKPVSLSELQIPKWSSLWDLDPAIGRVICSYDPDRNGVLISYTSLLNGSNSNYWYDIKTTGFYPEDYPDSCGIYCSFYYKALDSASRLMLYGSRDGYLRSFFDNQKDDVHTDDTNKGISSWVTLPPLQLNENLDEEGLLVTTTFILGGGAADSRFLDSDSMTYKLFAAADAETLLEDILDDAAGKTSGTISSTGRSSIIRPRIRGHYATFRLSNTTISETFAINRIIGRVKPVGKGGK